MNVYMYQAALLCEVCGIAQRNALGMEGKKPEDPEDEHTYDSDDYPKGPYSDGGGEADTPSHCDECHTFLENPLTTDGYDFVKDSIIDHLAYPSKGNVEVLREWADYYDITLKDML